MYRAALEGAMAWVDGMSIRRRGREPRPGLRLHPALLRRRGRRQGDRHPRLQFAGDRGRASSPTRSTPRTSPTPTRATRCRSSTPGRPNRPGTPTSARSTSTSSRARPDLIAAGRFRPGPGGAAPGRDGTVRRIGTAAGTTMVASVGVELEDVSVQFGNFVAVRDASVRDRARRVLLLPRPVRLRQDHDPAHRLGLPRADRGPGADRRQGHGRHRPEPPPDRADLPESRSVPADAGLGEHRLRARGQGWPRADAAPQRAERAARADRAARPGRQAGPRAFGRPEAARRDRARACAPSRRCCCSTSRSPRSTSSCASTCAPSCARSSSRVGLTFIYITHDQGEALTMSDHVAVMREGVIEQIADGRTIYDDPATAFVASFVGENNAFTGQVSTSATAWRWSRPRSGRCAPGSRPRPASRLKPGDRAMVFIRPEALASPSPAARRGRTGSRAGSRPRSSRARSTTCSWRARGGTTGQDLAGQQGSRRAASGVGDGADARLRSAEGGGPAAGRARRGGMSRLSIGGWARSFVERNGWLLAGCILVAVTFWILVLIVLPQLVMLDFSLRLRPAAGQAGRARGRLDARQLPLFPVRLPGQSRRLEPSSTSRCSRAPSSPRLWSPCSTSDLLPDRLLPGAVGRRRTPRASWPWRWWSPTGSTRSCAPSPFGSSSARAG